MAIGDIIAVGGSDEFRVDSSGNVTCSGTLTPTGTAALAAATVSSTLAVTGNLTHSALLIGTVTTVDMANAGHALVTGTAGAAQTQLTSNVVFVDPNGGAQDLTLPAEANFTGMLMICNTADAAEAVTVKDDAAGTIITLDQNQSGLVACDGTTWRGFMGAVT